jgi:hypothetical protein
MLMVRTGDEVIKDLKTLGWAWFSGLVERILETGVDVSKNDGGVFC